MPSNEVRMPPATISSVVGKRAMAALSLIRGNRRISGRKGSLFWGPSLPHIKDSY